MHWRSGFKNGPTSYPATFNWVPAIPNGRFFQRSESPRNGEVCHIPKDQAQKTKKRTHYASFPLYRPGGVRGAIESAAPGAAWVLGVSNQISKCQNSFIKSHHVSCPPLIISPPAAPHIPQGRPQICTNFAFGTSLASSF